MRLRNGGATVGCAGSGIPRSAGFLFGFQIQASALCGGLSPPSERLCGSGQGVASL